MTTVTIPKTKYQQLQQKAQMFDVLWGKSTETPKGTKSGSATWKEIRPIMKKVRKVLFKETYPKLYAKEQTKRAHNKKI
jgi:hypothetical protein